MQYAVVIMILFLVFLLYKMKNQIKQVNYLNDILYIKKQPESYIEEMEKILSSRQTEKSRIINTIQKTTGMLYAGRFDDIIETLEKLDTAPKNWMPIYHQNMVLALYFKKDKNKANEEFKKAGPVLDDFRKNEYYKEFIDIVYAVSDFYNGRSSKKYFAELAQTGANDYRKSFGYYFLGMINKKDKNSDEADKNFQNAMEYGKGSFIERLSALG